jgi:hypothetical protein
MLPKALTQAVSIIWTVLLLNYMTVCGVFLLPFPRCFLTCATQVWFVVLSWAIGLEMMSKVYVFPPKKQPQAFATPSDVSTHPPPHAPAFPQIFLPSHRRRGAPLGAHQDGKAGIFSRRYSYPIISNQGPSLSPRQVAVSHPQRAVVCARGANCCCHQREGCAPR